MICPKCNEEIIRGKTFKCSGECKRRFHKKCLRLVKKKCKTRRLCDDCFNNVKPVQHETLYVQNTIPSDNVSQKLSELNKQMDSLTSTMSALQSENERLKEDNVTLKSTITRLCIRPVPCENECRGSCQKQKEPEYKREQPQETTFSCGCPIPGSEILSGNHTPNNYVKDESTSYHSVVQERDNYIGKCYCWRGPPPKETSTTYEPFVIKETPIIFEPPVVKEVNVNLETESAVCTCRAAPKVMRTALTLGCPPVEQNLSIVQVDPKIQLNGQCHHTLSYFLMSRSQTPQLVVRRGDPFAMSISLNRRFNVNTDLIYVVFKHKNDIQPSLWRKTYVYIPLKTNQEVSTQNWTAYIQHFENNVISVLITAPPNSFIGQWMMEIDAIMVQDVLRHKSPNTYKYNNYIYLLFNAWCKDDSVYLEGVAEREEYVLRDTGLIWLNMPRNDSMAWRYGQFEEDILECSLMVLARVANLQIGYWHDPVMISRSITAAVNSNDDNGILQCLWGHEAKDGTLPGDWSGSIKILRKYYASRRPVKYGQCFVFAGVSNTIYRALGIPARVISNAPSAHDSDFNLTIDTFIDECGRVVSGLSRDSIWDFHVWNEVWFKRPDLQTGYDGWQVVDSTPQEPSQSKFHCGPSPVIAVKNGDVNIPYDTKFVYAEVNADDVTWKVQGNNRTLKLIKATKNGIGRSIYTKAVGKNISVNVTGNYKFREGPRKEREKMFNSLNLTGNAFSRFYVNEAFNDIHFKFFQDEEHVLGATNRMFLVAKNVSDRDYHVTIPVSLTANTYFGKCIKNIKNGEYKLFLPAGAEEKTTIDLKFEDYPDTVNPNYFYRINALCKIDGTEFEEYISDTFKVVPPILTIKMDESPPIVHSLLYGAAFFKNPLPVTLTNCKYVIEGPSSKGLKYKIDDVPENGIAKVTFKMTPIFSGEQTIMAKFSSDVLQNIFGYTTINVIDSAKPNVRNG